MDGQLCLPVSGRLVKVVPVRSTESQEEKITKETTKTSVRTITTITTSRHADEKIVNKTKKTITTTTSSNGFVLLSNTPEPSEKMIHDADDGWRQESSSVGRETSRQLSQSIRDGREEDRQSGSLAGMAGDSQQSSRYSTVPTGHTSSQTRSGYQMSQRAGDATMSRLNTGHSNSPYGTISHTRETVLEFTAADPEEESPHPFPPEGELSTNSFTRQESCTPQSLSETERPFLDHRSIWDIGQIITAEKRPRKRISCYKDYLSV